MTRPGSNDKSQILIQGGVKNNQTWSHYVDIPLFKAVIRVLSTNNGYNHMTITLALWGTVGSSYFKFPTCR